MKERYLRLIDACGDDEEILSFIEDAAANFEGYVRVVYLTETQRAVRKKTLTGEDLRSELSRLDQVRHNAHEAAIGSARQLNRLARANNVQMLFEGDETNRYEIADFCMQFVKEVFDSRVL